MEETTLRFAFKEWAVICQALAEGRQALILRKGGISEDSGAFQVEHRRFWLYPTYTHQQRDGIQTEAIPLLEQAEAERPSTGTVRLTHFAEVAGIYHVRNLTAALLLNHLHLWSEATVRARFAYRTPGLYVLPVRIYRAERSMELQETEAFAGCRSWVDLGVDLPTSTAKPVLSESDFRAVMRSLDTLLQPTAQA